jgi:hypothetical protein
VPKADEPGLPALADGRDQGPGVGYWAAVDAEGEKRHVLRDAQAPQMSPAALEKWLDDDLALDLDRALDLALDRALDLDRASDRTSALDLARGYALFVSSVLYALHQDRSRSWAGRLGIGRDAEVRSEQLRLANTYMDLYLDLRILHERIQSNLPAVEGIRIVRDRRRADSG